MHTNRQSQSTSIWYWFRPDLRVKTAVDNVNVGFDEHFKPYVQF